jgi:hypothetical protein
MMAARHPPPGSNSMPIFGYSVQRRTVGLTVAMLYGAALLFWWVQNNWRPVGGDMALQKALWLATAINLWFVLPAFIVVDVRTPSGVRRVFAGLLALMVARGVAELPMLYAFHNWSPWYGIAHDVLCAGVLAWGLTQVAGASGAMQWRAHLAFTGAAFMPEIYFAWYMQAYFHNQGAGAIYYVPDDPAHRLALHITTASVACFGAWMTAFVYQWRDAGRAER